jgi:mono/diheme cytochrome c family protein
MPRPIIYILLFLVALSLIPMGLIYKARATRGRQSTRIQVVYDMDQQYSFKAQQENPFFADGRAMRDQPEGTVARGMLQDNPMLFTGTTDGDSLWVETIPVEITREFVDRGQERFNIFCAPCHGISGNGNGMVNVRAAALGEGTWTTPTDLANQAVVDQPAGQIYNTIRNGIRNMPAYGPQISPEDRWAIVSYVRAIQAARNSNIGDLPEDDRKQLK